MHLVCGGGTGSSLMRELTDRGYDVSAGVLNALDSDEVTGRELGLPMAVEAPFSPVGDDAHAENLRLIADADLVVLAAVPLGHGNARNLDAVRGALARGAPVWVLEGLLGQRPARGRRCRCATPPPASCPTRRRCWPPSPRRSARAALEPGARRPPATTRVYGASTYTSARASLPAVTTTVDWTGAGPSFGTSGSSTYVAWRHATVNRPRRPGLSVAATWPAPAPPSR